MRSHAREGAPEAAAAAPQAGAAILACGAGSPCGCGEADWRAIQRFAGNRAIAEAVPPSVSATLSEPGQAMEPETLSAMEGAFRRDLGGVRIHAGPGAARAADDIGALAFTSGDHIVFGAGQYRPGSAEGRRLLAHELTHVAQQAEGRTGMLEGVGGDVGARATLEREAARAPLPSARGGDASSGRSLGGAGPTAARAGGAVQATRAPSAGRGRGPIQMRAIPAACRRILNLPGRSDPATGRLVESTIRALMATRIGPPFRFSLPDASAGAMRTEDKDLVIPPQVFGSKQSGTGIPDLGFRSPSGSVLVAEVKPANWLRIDFAERQVRNYISKGRSRDNADIRKKLGVTSFRLMRPSDFMPPATLRIGPRRFHVRWCGPGLIMYKEIKKKDDKKKKKRKKKEDRKRKERRRDRTSGKRDTKKAPKKKPPAKPKAKPAPKPKPKATPKPKAGAKVGAFNFGLGISIGGAGAGAANLGVGISINSSGVAVGTVSAGIAYDSEGAAIATASAGAAISSTGAAAGTAGAGATVESESAAAGVAGAGTVTGSRTAAAGVAGTGTVKDATGAVAGRTGSGSVEGKVGGGAAEGRGEGAAAGRAGGPGAPGAAREGEPPTGVGEGGAPGAAREGEGPGGEEEPEVEGREGEGPEAEGEKAGAGGARTGEQAGRGGAARTPGAAGGGAGGAKTGAISDQKLAEIVKRLGLPPGKNGPGERAVVDAFRLDQLVTQSTTAQKMLLKVLAAESETGVYMVPEAAWLEMILLATKGLTEEDLQYLATLEWHPDRTTVEELRKAIQAALAQRRKEATPQAERRQKDRRTAPKAEGGRGDKPSKDKVRETAEEKEGGREKPARKSKLAGMSPKDVVAALDALDWSTVAPGELLFLTGTPGALRHKTRNGTRLGLLANVTTKRSGGKELVVISESSPFVLLDEGKEDDYIGVQARGKQREEFHEFLAGRPAGSVIFGGDAFVGFPLGER
jgi:hypothetical protein